MDTVIKHSWRRDYKRAIGLQKDLSKRIMLCPLRKIIRYVAGADTSYDKDKPIVYGVLVVYRLPDLVLVERVWVARGIDFPYIPGLFAFREGPVLIEAAKRLTIEPDIMVFHGQGIAHPRRLGLASHLGLLFDRPSIGCAEHNLVGNYEKPGNMIGDYSELVYNSDVVGVALRTRRGVKPVFVSPGHKIDLQGAINVILQVTRGYRMPQVLREAHRYANEIRLRNIA